MSDLKVRFSVNGEEAEYSRIDEKDIYYTFEEANFAVNYIIKNMLGKNAVNVKHSGLQMVDTICEDGTVVVGRLDGTFDGGEFYIEIIELNESIV